MVQVREAHPGEHSEPPRSTEEDLKYARALKMREELPWPRRHGNRFVAENAAQLLI